MYIEVFKDDNLPTVYKIKISPSRKARYISLAQNLKKYRPFLVENLLSYMYWISVHGLHWDTYLIIHR